MYRSCGGFGPGDTTKSGHARCGTNVLDRRGCRHGYASPYRHSPFADDRHGRGKGEDQAEQRTVVAAVAHGAGAGAVHHRPAGVDRRSSAICRPDGTPDLGRLSIDACRTRRSAARPCFRTLRIERHGRRDQYRYPENAGRRSKDRCKSRLRIVQYLSERSE